MTHLFTYGSLIFPEVVNALTERDFHSELVTARGFARFCVRAKSYPGLVVSDGSRVDGRIYFDVDDESMVILDKFEDKAYERIEAKILTALRGEITAAVYLIRKEYLHILSDQQWQPEEFESRHLKRYTAMCRKIRPQILADLSGLGRTR